MAPKAVPKSDRQLRSMTNGSKSGNIKRMSSIDRNSSRSPTPQPDSSMRTVIKKIFSKRLKRKPRILTGIRRDKIEDFFLLICSDPDKFSFGKPGTALWNSELLKFMKEPRHFGLLSADISYWVHTYPSFFYLAKMNARKRFRWSNPESSGSSSPNDTSSDSGVQGDVSDQSSPPNPEPVADQNSYEDMTIKQDPDIYQQTDGQTFDLTTVKEEHPDLDSTNPDNWSEGVSASELNPTIMYEYPHTLMPLWSISQPAYVTLPSPPHLTSKPSPGTSPGKLLSPPPLTRKPSGTSPEPSAPVTNVIQIEGELMHATTNIYESVEFMIDSGTIPPTMESVKFMVGIFGSLINKVREADQGFNPALDICYYATKSLDIINEMSPLSGHQRPDSQTPTVD